MKKNLNLNRSSVLSLTLFVSLSSMIALTIESKAADGPKPKVKKSNLPIWVKPKTTPTSIPTDKGHVVKINHELTIVREKQKVDFLFVIDNSSSMADEQKALKEYFTSFLSNQVNFDDLDFQIGVITTDAYKRDGKLYSKIKGKKWIKSEGLTKEEIVSEFSKNTHIELPQNEDEEDFRSKEKPMESVLSALLKDRIEVGGRNAGFIRNDAKLAIIMLGDEDEASDIARWKDEPDHASYKLVSNDKVNEFYNRLLQIKGSMDQIKIQIISKPDRYALKTLSEKMKTTIVDIESNFQSQVVSFGSDAIKQDLITVIQSKDQNIKSVSVIVDGQEVDQNLILLSSDRRFVQLDRSKLSKGTHKVSVEAVLE